MSIRRWAAAAIGLTGVATLGATVVPPTAVATVPYTTITIKFVGPETANLTKVHLEHDTETTTYHQRSYRVWPDKTVQNNLVRFRIPTAQTHGLVLVYESPRSTLFTDAVPVVIQTYKARKVGAAITGRQARDYAGKAAWGWHGTTRASVFWRVGVTSKQVHTSGEFGQYGWKRIVIMYRTRNQAPISPVAANWMTTYDGTIEFNGEPWVFVH